MRGVIPARKHHREHELTHGDLVAGEELGGGAAEVRGCAACQDVDGHFVPVEAKSDEEVANHVRRHNFCQTSDLPLHLLLLGEHDLTGIYVHHDPAAGRDEGRGVVQVEVLGHRPHILVITIVIHRVQNVLSTFVFVFVLLLDLLPAFERIYRALGEAATAAVVRVVPWTATSAQILLLVLHFSKGVRLRCEIYLRR